MTKEYRTDPSPPSDMFVDSIDFGVGSAYMECGWCGREHKTAAGECNVEGTDGGA